MDSHHRCDMEIIYWDIKENSANVFVSDQLSVSSKMFPVHYIRVCCRSKIRVFLACCCIGISIPLFLVWPQRLTPNRIKEMRKKSSEVLNVTTAQKQEYNNIKTFPLDAKHNRSIELLQALGVVMPATSNIPADTKIILWFVKQRSFPYLANLHPLRKCPDLTCRITSNRFFFNQSEAVIFALPIVNNKTSPPKLKNQVWVLQNHEPPIRSQANENTAIWNQSWRSKFNWTWDYRDDSDIITKYGKVIRREFIQNKNYSSIVGAKTGDVAWMVSNCHTDSKRERYVRELQKYVTVDIFGKCGSRRCGRGDDKSCLEYLSMHYKFYLSFESAFCRDYVTEKFFRYYKMDAILIVRGGGDYNRFVPRETVLNTADFTSPKDLAGMIKKLSGHNELYIRMLQIKDQYLSIVEEWPIVANGRIIYASYRQDAESYCELCRRLWNQDTYRKHYPDIRPYFRKGLCSQPTDLHF